jgi:hypothetical protein
MKSVLQGMRNTAAYISENQDVEGSTVTIRPSATAMLAVDSDDRYLNYLQRRTNPSYPFSFNIQKNESLLNGFFKRLALTEFRLNWTIPNVSSVWGNNRMFIFWKVGAGATTQTTITLDDGFYGAEEIANELQNQIGAAITNFQVEITDKDNDVITFSAPSNTTFYIGNQGSTIRELVDMLNVPSFAPGVTGTFVPSLKTGIPNLRPMDYFDIVCSQLSYNQELKDATSAPITRDMIARIYLDDSVPSLPQITTNYYNNVVVTTTISAGTYTNPIGIFTVASSANFKVNDEIIITGIVGGTDWNGNYVITEILSGTSIEATPVQNIPSGTPSSFASAVMSKFNVNQFSIPQTTWDDRVNGVTPFVLYRQFSVPKQIRWNNKMPIGNLTFELYDDQGRNIQDLWNSVYPPTTVTGLNYANSFVWNATILISED